MAEASITSARCPVLVGGSQPDSRRNDRVISFTDATNAVFGIGTEQPVEDLGMTSEFSTRNDDAFGLDVPDRPHQSQSVTQP